MSEKICNSCGTKLNEDAEYCNNCGAKYEKKKRNSVAVEAYKWSNRVSLKGIIIGTLICIVLIIGGTVSGATGDESAFFESLIYGIILCYIIASIYSTIAFIIKMAAEAIQLLDDIKNK